MKIGVLALQGAFREHCRMIARCGADACEIRQPTQMDEIDGLIIPGGESTTIGKLMMDWGFFPAITQRHNQGMAIFGTCAGMILLCTDIASSKQPRLGLLAATVRRNAFGRQKESFESLLEIPVLGLRPFPAVFIRAPYIEKCGAQCEPLGMIEKKIVLVRQGRILACAFHPELSHDTRLHRYFLELAK